MNRPNHAIIWLIAAISVAACLGTASLGPSRSARPVAALNDPPRKVAGPTARDLRLQAMHRLMTPVQTPIAVAPVAQEAVPVQTVEVAAVEAAEQVELNYESSCGRDLNTGKVYSLPTEESEQPIADDASVEPEQAEVRRLNHSPTVRQSVRRASFVIYRRPSLVLKTDDSVRRDPPGDRMQSLLQSAADRLSLGALQSVSQVWSERLNLPWSGLTAKAEVQRTDESAELPPDRESRAVWTYRSVLRNRTLQ